VTENKKIPDNSLVVGAPAKVVRTLDKEAERGLKWSADHYVENGNRFMTGLKTL